MFKILDSNLSHENLLTFLEVDDPFAEQLRSQSPYLNNLEELVIEEWISELNDLHEFIKVTYDGTSVDLEYLQQVSSDYTSAGATLDYVLRGFPFHSTVAQHRFDRGLEKVTITKKLNTEDLTLVDIEAYFMILESIAIQFEGHYKWKQAG